jgi:hypothetical protein
MESGEEAQNNREPRHKTEQSGAGDQEPQAIPPRQPMVEANSATSQKECYFNKFANWVSLLTLLFVAAYTVITFVQWRSNHIFNKKQLRAINAQLSEMRGAAVQTDQTIATLQGQLGLMDIAQRPWLTLSRATPTNVIVTDSFVIIGLDLRARNIGHSPAEKASAWGKAYPSLSITEESDAAKKVCKDAFGQNLEFLKIMILPDEDLPIEDHAFLIGMQEITKARMARIDYQSAGRLAMLGKEEADAIRDEEMAQPLSSTFTIVGCITYAYRGGNALGQTAFILDVDRPCPESPVGKCTFDVSRPRKYGAKDVMGTEVRRGLFAR